MKALADTVDIVIGIDPHKHTHTAAIVAAVTGKKLASCTVHARPSGFSELMQIAISFPGTRCWVIEGCGSWGRGLAAWLMSNGETVREIDSPRRPARRMGKKNDDIDATRAAREALGRDDLAELSRITLKAPPMFALMAPLETRFLGFRRGDYFSFFGSISSLFFGGFLSGRGFR